jgi:hypothetical protein
MILWSNILIPVTSMMITVFATLYTVSERIKNENKEKHKPYVTLNDIEQLEKLDEYKYYFTVFGRNYRKTHQEYTLGQTTEIKKKEYIEVRLLLDNIGYGVASNIKFYDLLTGEQIKGTQTPSKEKNQKLLTTFDIASSKEKQVQVRIFNKIEKDEEIELPDHCRILCIYQDLNGNTYDFIISINIKSNNSYDFFTYQRTSHSYTRWIKENKKNYKKIIREYKK